MGRQEGCPRGPGRGQSRRPLFTTRIDDPSWRPPFRDKSEHDMRLLVGADSVGGGAKPQQRGRGGRGVHAGHRGVQPPRRGPAHQGGELDRGLLAPAAARQGRGRRPARRRRNHGLNVDDPAEVAEDGRLRARPGAPPGEGSPPLAGPLRSGLRQPAIQSLAATLAIQWPPATCAAESPRSSATP